MSGSRSSSRLAARDSSPSSSRGKSPSPLASTGTKRKQDPAETPSTKHGKNTADKKQKKLEETTESVTVPAKDDRNDAHKDTSKPSIDEQGSNGVDGSDNKPDGTDVEDGHEKHSTKDSANRAIEPDARKSETPSSILEKGIIYFFFRGRVGIDDPSRVDEIARSYMVLRPLPHGAKIGDGEIGDASNCRLLSLPKKILPSSGKDRFMVFVDKTQLSFKDLKDTFLSASDYETQTAGTRHTPPATPVGEGIYAITSTGRESHLAYLLTIPSEVGQVQRDIGLHERGSFVTSTKNPSYPSPPNASLPQSPEYPKEIIDEFRSLRWMPMQPRHIDYPNGQVLLIGEGDDGVEKAAAPQQDDEKEGKEKPLEEMERLEEEDGIRVEHLQGDDAVFADLRISSKDYPKLKSTW